MQAENCRGNLPVNFSEFVASMLVLCFGLAIPELYFTLYFTLIFRNCTLNRSIEAQPLITTIDLGDCIAVNRLTDSSQMDAMTEWRTHSVDQVSVIHLRINH